MKKSRRLDEMHETARGLERIGALWRTVLLVPLAALLLGAGSATASDPPQGKVLFTSTYSYVPLLNDRDVFPAAGEQSTSVLTSPAIMMQPGEMRRVTGQLDFRMPGGHDNPEVGFGVRCFDQNGHQIATSGSGTNYTGSGDAYQWNASLLLVAPAKNPAENYFCQLLTYVSSPHPSGWQMTVLAPTKGQMTYGTWLQFSSSNEVGAQTWSYGIGVCQTNGSSGCAYVGGPSRLGNPTAIDVFTGDVFPAGDDATTIDGLATFQITTCTSGTSSCPSNERGDSGVHDGKGDSWLELDQLNPNGSVCQVNRAYSEVPGRQVLLSESYDISDAQHHRPLYYHVSAPVSQLCGGSRRFAVDLHIQWTADNGVKIDGGWVNVINSVRATTTPVPAVIGLTQAQADAAITAAGLYMPAPNNVTATAPPGTVLAQNAPGGTIEPAGSPVQITVSLGQTTVPDVLGEQWGAAVQAITTAGLKAIAAPPIINCADQKKLGTVQSESPAAKAQVSPGSQVKLQLLACTK
jgi:hypothetical protein